MKDNARVFFNDVKKRLNGDLNELMQYVCDNLSSVNSKYNWTGIYVLRNGKLKLQAFCGKETEHVEINLGDGLCSMAITEDDVVNEPEVKSNTRYLACFPETESELVVKFTLYIRGINAVNKEIKPTTAEMRKTLLMPRRLEEFFRIYLNSFRILFLYI